MAPCFKDALSKLLFCIAFRYQISAINLMIHALDSAFTMLGAKDGAGFNNPKPPAAALA